VAQFSSADNGLLYTNSENYIGWIGNNLPNSGLPEKIKLFKNKILFRDLLADLFPAYV